MAPVFRLWSYCFLTPVDGLENRNVSSINNQCSVLLWNGVFSLIHLSNVFQQAPSPKSISSIKEKVVDKCCKGDFKATSCSCGLFLSLLVLNIPDLRIILGSILTTIVIKRCTFYFI